MFISSEARLRAAWLDECIDAYNQTIRTPEVAAALGDIATINTIVDSFYIPNISHNVIYPPKSCQDSDSTPFVPVLFGEELYVNSAMYRQSAAQRAVIADSDASDGLKKATETKWHLHKTSEDTTIFYHHGIIAQTFSGYTFEYNGERFMALSKPWVTFYKNKNTPPTNLDLGEVLLHESIHVRQQLENPLVCADEATYKTWTEMEAYHKGALALSVHGVGLLSPDPPTAIQSATLTAELLRKKYTRPDKPYTPTPEAINAYHHEDISNKFR